MITTSPNCSLNARTCICRVGRCSGFSAPPGVAGLPPPPHPPPPPPAAMPRRAKSSAASSAWKRTRTATSCSSASLSAALASPVQRTPTPPGFSHATPDPAWGSAPPLAVLDRICCYKYQRTVQRDHTVPLDGRLLQLAPGPGGRSYAGTRVEIHAHLDGTLAGYYRGQRLGAKGG